MDTYIRLDSRFEFNEHRKELIDTVTGEIYTEKRDVERILCQLKAEKQINKSIEYRMRETWGLETELQKYQLNWKEDSHFIKIYRTEMRGHKNNTKLSNSAGLLLLYIQDYIEYKTNKICKPNKESFTNKELQDLTGLGRDTIITSLNELEEALFIIRVGKGKAREIYFNPYLASAGNEVAKETLDLFRKYISTTHY